MCGSEKNTANKLDTILVIETMDPISTSDGQIDLKRDVVLNFGSLRNILCDQIIFDPSDDTVTVRKLQLRNGSFKQELPECRNGKAHCNELGAVSKHQETFEDLSRYNDEQFEDIVCLGATFIITIILLSVLTYCYLFKDYE